MNIVHLADSPFFGGPERQMLGLAQSLAPDPQVSFLCFGDGGTGRPFLDRVRSHGFGGAMLRNTNPHFAGMIREIAQALDASEAGAVLCHGYKANLLGWLAARRVGIPAVAVSRGWTGHTRKVRVYEALERRMLSKMDAVVCVSEAQAVKVRTAGVPASSITVIHNAIRTERFVAPDLRPRSELLGYFDSAKQTVVVAVGRLSPEKGFEQLVAAAADVVRQNPKVGFVVFGEGPSRQSVEATILSHGLGGDFVLAGFRDDVDRLLPSADLLAIPSFTEGLPNVALEACAAGVAVVATTAGGTPEVIEDGVNGFLVPPGVPQEMAARIAELIADEQGRSLMGARGQQRVRERFSFEQQAEQYRLLLQRILAKRQRTSRAVAVASV